MPSVFECYTERGKFWFLDLKSLPADLQDKVRRRADAGYTEPPPISDGELTRLDSEIARLSERVRKAHLDRADPSHIRHLNGLVKHAKAEKHRALAGDSPPNREHRRWLITAAVAVALLGWAVLISELLEVPVVILALSVWGAPTIGRWLTNRFQGRSQSSLVLTDAERSLVKEATRSVRISDNSRAIALLKRREQPSSVADLIAVAAHLVDLIRTSTAWTSRYLEPHRAQFDVNEEIRQIARNAVQYDTMRERLNVAPSGSSRTAELATTAQNIARQQLDAVWTTLLKRVDALADFASHIEQLDAELCNADIARQALEMDDDLAELMASAVGNELAAGQLRHMSEQAEGLTLAIRELVDQLHNDLQTLRAIAP